MRLSCKSGVAKESSRYKRVVKWQMIGATQVFDGDEVMLISNNGTLVRIPTEQISVVGRNTQGVKLISLKEGELLNSVERIADRQEDQTKD